MYVVATPNKSVGRAKTTWEPCDTVLIKTLWPTLKGYKWGYFVIHRKWLEPRVLPWQQHSGRHSCFFCFTLLVPSLNNTALIFPQLFSRVEGFAVSVEPPMTSSLSSFAQYKSVKTSKTKTDFQKREMPYFFTLKSLSSSYLLLHMLLRNAKDTKSGWVQIMGVFAPLFSVLIQNKFFRR